MKQQILKGAGLTFLALAVFLGVLLFVQRLNNDLDDINLVIHNFQHINKLGTPSEIVETTDEGTTTLYRIKDVNGVTIIRLDNKWVDNEMKMEVWDTTSDDKSTNDIVASDANSIWDLALSERSIGAIIFYKEIYMNQTVGLNQNNIIDDVLNGNVH